jgi:glycosyltransferase involved in cell wall biosynthesis
VLFRSIDQADFVIVNSCFVKETFHNRGWDNRRVFVAYTGLDDGLMNSKPTRKLEMNEFDCIHFQFAGEGCLRKGLPDLLRAFLGIEDYPWKLSIVGNIHSHILEEFDDFLHDERIKLIPYCSRSELLSEMGSTDVFVFPSLAEGSARVVFMAMAMGCYVITTENSGSIVRDGVNGTIVKPGDVTGLRIAIQDVFSNREIINKIGFNNSELIRCKYTQSSYGARIVEIFKEITSIKANK